MVKKHRLVILSLVLALFLLSMSGGTDSVNYAIFKNNNSQPCSTVWSDDFENETETLNQWLFAGYNSTHLADAIPNITLSEGMLYSTGPTRSYMFHNSTTIVGTWSLDVYIDYDFDYLYISFTSNYYRDPEIISGPTGYVVILEKDSSIIHTALAYWEPDMGSSWPDEIDTYSLNISSGWIHFDITRQPDSDMCVYLNGTLGLQGMDTRWSSSEYFALQAATDSYFIFDNITVSDTIDIDKASPHWTDPLADQLIIEGDDFHYSLHAYDSSGLDAWWVGDPTHFSIDQEGNLTSVEPLAAGNYNVEVSVNDTYGNVLSGTINLEVARLPSTTSATGTPTGTIYPTTTTGATPIQFITVLILTVSIGSVGIIVVMTALITRYRRGRLT